MFPDGFIARCALEFPTAVKSSVIDQFPTCYLDCPGPLIGHWQILGDKHYSSLLQSVPLSR